MRNILTETEQQVRTEMRNEPRVQVCRQKALRVPIERQIRATTMTAPTSRSESWRANVSEIECLSASIVHDLRNPLGAIYAAAEMLLDLDPELAQVRRLATNILSAAGRMREFLADLSSVALGTTPRLRCATSARSSLQQSMQPLAATENRSVQILLEVPEGIELPLIHHRMQSVFFNLIANALEAMPISGRLHMAAREASSCVLIEMEDTGSGIPPKIRDRLFEPFVTAGKQNGLGLGRPSPARPFSITAATSGLSQLAALVLSSAFR